MKKRQKARFLSQRSSKIIVTKETERRKRNSEEKERRKKNNVRTLSFYNNYFSKRFQASSFYAKLILYNFVVYTAPHQNVVVTF